jgi:MFS family permease
MAKGLLQNRQWNWYNFWICLAIGFTGQLAASYPSSIIGVTLAQPAFLEYMGLVTLIDGEQKLNNHADALIGATTGVFQAGAFFGVLMGSWVMDKYGRKAGTIFCAALSIVGGVCLCAAQNITMFIIFRFFAGAGSMAFVALIPVYSAELAPPALRGFFVGMNAVGITFGYCTASYMGLAFYYSESTAAQWRAPLGLGLVFPVAMLFVLLFVPESPRWLLMVGRVEEAREIVMKLHHVKGELDQEYARVEFYQMQMQTEFDQRLSPTWMQMFSRPSYRKRAIAACGFGFIGQSTAVLVINNYGPTIYKALGYGTLDQLILQCGWITLSIPSNILGVSRKYLDRVFRFVVTSCSGMHRGSRGSQATYARFGDRLLRLSHSRNRIDSLVCESTRSCS